MEYTQNKVNSLRRLLLGSLHDKCKTKGATREELEAQLTRIKQDGHCLQNCSVDDLINVCEMKSRTLPTCYSSNEEKERPCMDRYREDEFKRRNTLYNKEEAGRVQGNWMQYSTAKMLENFSDDDEEEEEEQDDKQQCLICQIDLEDEQGNKVEIIRLPCGHTVHPKCIIQSVVSTGKTVCPYCRQPIPNEYTGNIQMILQGKWSNYINTVNAANPELEPITQESLPFESWLQFEVTDEKSKETIATEEEKVLYKAFLDSEEFIQITQQQAQQAQEQERQAQREFQEELRELFEEEPLRQELLVPYKLQVNQDVNQLLQTLLRHMRENPGWALQYSEYDVSTFIDELYKNFLINEATKNMMTQFILIEVEGLLYSDYEQLRNFVQIQCDKIFDTIITDQNEPPCNYYALYSLICILKSKHGNEISLIHRYLAQKYNEAADEIKILFGSLARQTYNEVYLRLVTQMFVFMLINDFRWFDMSVNTIDEIDQSVKTQTFYRFLYDGLFQFHHFENTEESTRNNVIPIIVCFIKASFITVWISSINQKYKTWCNIIDFLFGQVFLDVILPNNYNNFDITIRYFKFINVTQNLLTDRSRQKAIDYGQYYSQNMNITLGVNFVLRNDEEDFQYQALPRVNAWRDQYLQGRMNSSLYHSNVDSQPRHSVIDWLFGRWMW